MAETAKLTAQLQALFDLAAQHQAGGRWAAAEAAYRRILAEQSDIFDVHYGLAVALNRQQKTKEAVAALYMALAFRPEFARGWSALGAMLHDMNRMAEAQEAYERALALDPTLQDTWNNLGNALRDTAQEELSLVAYRRALALNENYVLAWNNLALALKEIGRLDEALACFDRAIAIRSDDMVTQSNRLVLLHHHPACDAVAIHRAARQWSDRFARPLRGEIPNHDNDRSPQRRLRIGYVSPDFHRHCAAMFIAPLLANHDHNGFEIFCYANHANHANSDAVTARLQRHAYAWRDISALTDQAAAEMILDDKIDILMDLALHTAGNRLGVFARKPAPIQVTWLGYPGTTGLDTIDYRITDPRLDPLASTPEIPGDSSSKSQIPNPKSEILKVGTQEPHYSERSVRLPDSFWCYDPRGMDLTETLAMPDPSPLPALSADHVTFGCFNNFSKVTDLTLDLWAGVMAAVPGSRLILVASSGAHRQRVVEKLKVTDPGRVEFIQTRPREEYLTFYHRVDLCLDPIPCNGGTTTQDALWMGVPVVTLKGKTVVGRAGWSLLHVLDMTEFMAQNEEQYVQIAAQWAGDLDRLRALRATLRKRMIASPLMDGPRFARNMESAYRQMWRAWCNTDSN